MISDNDIKNRQTSRWPIEAQQWLNGWREPGQLQTPEQIKKTNDLIEILNDLVQKAEAGELTRPDVRKSAIDRLIAVHDEFSLKGLARRDCKEAWDARNIVDSIIRTYPERKAEVAPKAVLEGLQPSDFG